MIKDAIWVFIAIVIAIWGMIFMFSGQQRVLPLLGVFGMAVSGLIIARRVSPYIADAIGASFYYSHDKLNRRPEQLTRLEGMAGSGEAVEAAAELEDILRKDFNQTEARMLLAQIRLDKLDDAEGARALLEAFFKSPKHVSGSVSLGLLLLYGDLLYGAGGNETAAHCYANELKRGKFSRADRQLLVNRLEALKDS
jgi:hypothetical protein